MKTTKTTVSHAVVGDPGRSAATGNWNTAFRPKQLQQLDLRSVKTYLTSLLTAQFFPRAMIFAGPKGTGKTTSARIIGALLNDPANELAVRQRFFGADGAWLPLQEPDSLTSQAKSIFAGQSLLVQELDAASNRGIDDVRALRERVYQAPAGGVISVYILDEAHMLTTEAFNALLKLLEEPPAHAIFILATTELHKIPATVVSRCQLVQFTQATSSELADRLQAIVIAQHLTHQPADVSAIAQLAQGSFRDAIKILQQSLSYESPAEFLASVSHQQVGLLQQELIAGVVDKLPITVVTTINQLRSLGVREEEFATSLLSWLHDQVLSAILTPTQTTEVASTVARFLLRELLAAELTKPSPIPFLRLELVLLDIIERALSKQSRTEPPGSTHATTVPVSDQLPPKTSKVVSAAPIESPVKLVLSELTLDNHVAVLPVPSSAMVSIVEKPELLSIVAAVAVSPAESESSASDHIIATGSGEQICQHWHDVVEQVATHNYSLAALLRSATPSQGDAGSVTLQVFYDFHKEQILQPRWLRLLHTVLGDVGGGPIQLECVVVKPVGTANLKQATSLPGFESFPALAVEALL